MMDDREPRDVRQLQAQLLHLSRISTMETMASTIAHELSQPSGAVINYVNGCKRMLANGSVPVSQTILDALDAAALNAHHAGEIVRRMRRLASRGDMTFRAESLPSLAQEVLELGKLDAAAEGVACTLHFDPKAALVLVDRIQIQQVLITLIRNAMEAVRVAHERRIALSTTHRDDGMAEIRIEDSGPGLSDAVMAALFSPFSTGAGDRVGIGLSISRTIVEAHGGKIAGSNAAGGGALFSFTIPLAPDGGSV